MIQRKIKLPVYLTVLSAFYTLHVLFSYSPYSDRFLIFTQQSSRGQVPQSGVVKEPSDPSRLKLNVHYILYHKSRTPGPDSSISFLDCISLLSVIKNLAPDHIYVHTNVPRFWPFVSCNAYIKNWTTVKLIRSQIKRFIDGKEIPHLQHEADIRKLEVLSQYGGLALDFDVFIIDGQKLRSLLTQHACVVCKERGLKLNGGIIGCKKEAAYPRLLLERSYLSGYKPYDYLFNFQDVPWALYQENPKLAHALTGICDTPKMFINNRSWYNWTDRIALHSYIHNRSFTKETLDNSESCNFVDLLNWILSK